MLRPGLLRFPMVHIGILISWHGTVSVLSGLTVNVFLRLRAVQACQLR